MAKYTSFVETQIIPEEFEGELELPPESGNMVTVLFKRLGPADAVMAQLTCQRWFAFAKHEQNGSLDDIRRDQLLADHLGKADELVRPNVLDPDDGEPFFPGGVPIDPQTLAQAMRQLAMGPNVTAGEAEVQLKKTRRSPKPSPSRKRKGGR